jgi:hypothetical protein
MASSEQDEREKAFGELRDRYQTNLDVLRRVRR